MSQRTITHRKEPRKRREAPVLGLMLCAYPEKKLDGTALALGKGGTLGREGSLLQLTADARCSRVHASISKNSAGDFVLRDEKSKNGTFVNGARTEAITLAEHDVIRIGDTVFVFELLGQPVDFDELVGSSARFTRELEAAQRLATAQFPVLLSAETGSGKEVFARFIHQQSRCKGALVTVNCAAIPDALFESEMFGYQKGAFSGALQSKIGFVEQAENGTLFLDEIGEMPAAQQAKLLRLIEAGDFMPVGGTAPKSSTARIVAATNAAIDDDKSGFRRDLYARFATGLLRIPPLREHKGDLPAIAKRFYPGADLDADLIEKLLVHDWPMNVRELRAVMQRLELHGDVGDLLDDDEAASPKTPRRPTMDKDVFIAAATECTGNVVQLGKRFDVDRRQIYRWFEAFGVTPEQFREK